MNTKPIFISGIGRSGTSALIRAIAEHHQVKKPNEIGEAPFVTEFLKFVHHFEYTSPSKDYNLKNYKLDAPTKQRIFSDLMASVLYGEETVEDDSDENYWIAKTSLSETLHSVAKDVFEEVRTVHIVRNGIEVVNSAKSFAGFSNLDFTALCNRWSENLKQTTYLQSDRLSAVIRHQDMVQNSQAVFSGVFEKLEMEQNPKASNFIDSTLFNSSFDNSAQISSAAKVFQDRLKCWDDWSEQEKSTFIEICDSKMIEYGLARPYADCAGISNEGIWIGTTPTAKMPAKPSVEVKAPSTEPQKHNKYSTNVVKAVADLMPPAHLKYHINISEKNNFLYLENPKVASTTALRMLAKQEDPVISTTMKTPHDKINSPFSNLLNYSPEEQDKLLFGDDIYRFTMVRNPFSRLLSAYMSKISKNLKPKREVLAIINGVDVEQVKDLTQEVSFDEFVEVVVASKDFSMNPHWKPQVSQILFNHIRYNRIVYFENLEEDLSKVWTDIYKSNVNGLAKPGNKTSATELVKEYYSDSTRKLVANRFENDFSEFGYSDSLEKMTPLDLSYKNVS